MMDESKLDLYKRSLGDFVCLNQGDTFNVLLGIAIFVIFGWGHTINKHGDGYSYTSACYDTCIAIDGNDSDYCKDEYTCFTREPHCFNGDDKPDFAMGYCAGVNGPGSYPVTLILMIAAIIIYFTKMAKYFCCPDRIEKKRRYDQIIMSERQSSYQSQMGGSGGDK